MSIGTLVRTVAAMLVLGATVWPQAPVEPRHKAVFQVNVPQGREWALLYSHVTNLLADFEQEGGIQVEVVFYSDGIEMVTKNSPFAPTLEQIATKGVKLVACRNSMRSRDMTSTDLLPFVGEVDSGVGELVRKQEAGWAYIR